MLSVNGKKLYIKIIWNDYIKDIQNLEKYIIDLFYLTKNLNKPNDHMWYNKNEIEIK